jgi:WD40 repeat protein
MQVQVWDGQAGVLMDSFRQHTADVLALAASADGSSVFAAGVDGKVICLQKVPTQCHNDGSTLTNDRVCAVYRRRVRLKQR